MSTDRDVTRIVRSWLEEGVTALPDRVLDAVLDQLPATPQRRAPWPARRLRDMNILLVLPRAAAAVAVDRRDRRDRLPKGVEGPRSAAHAHADRRSRARHRSRLPCPPGCACAAGTYYIDESVLRPAITSRCPLAGPPVGPVDERSPASPQPAHNWLGRRRVITWT